MTNSPRFLSAHIIGRLRRLDGRAHVTFPYKESGDTEKSRLARVERVQKVPRGTADNIRWLLDWETADEEWPNAKLVEQVKIGEDDQHAEVYRKWEELTGLPLVEIEIYRAGIYKETIRQRVPAGTPPTGATGFVLSDSVNNTDEILAERETVKLVDSAGNDIAGDSVLTSERTDQETGVVICTDHFLSTSSYTLPVIYVGGTRAQIAAHYPAWKWPLRLGSIGAINISNGGSGYTSAPTVTIAGAAAAAVLTNGVVTGLRFSSLGSGLTGSPPTISFSGGGGSGAAATCTLATSSAGYTALNHEPPRYVIDARKQSAGDETDKFLVEVDYCRIPDARVEDRDTGYTFPGLFFYNNELAIPSNYAGQYPPPWPIGEDQFNGYRVVPPRQISKVARTYITYSLGRTEAMPEEYSVTSPGNGSRIFGRFIGEKTIHPPIYLFEEISGLTVVVEDIPSSTPASYDPHLLLIIRSEEKKWQGEIHEQRVTYISEATPISAFPDPIIFGYYTASAAFKGTPSVLLDAPLKGGKLIAYTSTGTASLTLYGRQNAGDPGVSASEVMSLTTSPAASALSYIRVTEALLNIPLATGTVTIAEAADPDTASLLFTAQPAHGDKLIVGLAATSAYDKTYTYVNALLVDGILSVAVTAAGTGFTSVPTVVFGGGGTGATATATLKAVSKTIAAGGTGYAVNDVLTLSGGTFTTAATFTVLAVSGGVVTSASITNAGVYTVPQTGAGSATTGGGGAGCTLTVGYGVGAVTMTSFGHGYTAPTVSFTGGAGSGATATATLEKNLILIATTLAHTARNTVKAIIGTGLDTYASAETPNADASAELDASNAKLVNFAGRSPTVTGSSWTFGIFENDGTTPETFATVNPFVAGSDGQTLAVIPAGTPYAYWTADFASNTCLVDDSPDDDRKALPTLPAGRVLYTDWLQIPDGKAITLIYAARGTPALRTAWQKSATAAEPATVTVSLGTCTLDSTAFITAIDAGYIKCKVLVGDDTRENEFFDTTHLLRAYKGTTGTQSGVITPLVATLIANAAAGKIRKVSIGTPGAQFIRLKFTRPGNAAFQYQPIFAQASWLVTPND